MGSVSRYQLGLLRAVTFPMRRVGTGANYLSCLSGRELHPREKQRAYSSERKEKWKQRCRVETKVLWW